MLTKKYSKPGPKLIAIHKGAPPRLGKIRSLKGADKTKQLPDTSRIPWFKVLPKTRAR